MIRCSVLFFFSFIMTELSAQTENCFALNSKGKKVEDCAINKLFAANSSFSINDTKSIVGLSIDAEVKRTDKNYHVRVLIKDKDRKEHLVIEAYKELWDEEKFVVYNYCEESVLLNEIYPDSIKIYISNASIRINKIHIAYSTPPRTINNVKEEFEKIRRNQIESIVERINDFNKKNNKLWIAGITSLSCKSYEQKKRLFDIKNGASLDGFEYYIGGIFEASSNDRRTRSVSKSLNSVSKSLNNVSTYIDSFDWRNRHGRNWITPIKSQGNSNYCVAFASTATVESLVNLYKNDKVDLSLSVQEIACCAADGNVYENGMYHTDALDYLKTNGVCDSLSYPFIDEPGQVCMSDIIIPQTRIYISDYSEIYYLTDSIKDALIHNGPLLSGYRGHAMSLVGYGKINAGDSLFYYVWINGEPHYDFIPIPAGNPNIGKTFWIFKNSLVDNEHSRNGYTYLLFEREDYVEDCFLVKMSSFNDNEISCVDEDGDGYYFWGIGDKPSHCPSWAPDTPDGDDSDINFGPLNQYGLLQSLPSGITIKTPKTYSGSVSESRRIGIVNGGTLTITGSTTLTGNAKIRVCENGILIIDGGSLNDAKIEMVPGGKLIIRNNGTINMAYGENFNAPAGALVEIEEGEIVQY